MATLKPFALSAACRSGQAGISRAAFVDFADIQSVDFDANLNITDITLSGGATWTEIEFEQEGTAFLNHEFSSNKSSVNVAANLTMFIPQLDETAWDVDYNLSRFCNLVGIVLLNNNKTRVPGLEWVSGTTGASIKKRGFKKTGGTDNSGADPTADSAEMSIILTANQGVNSHYWTGLDWSTLSFT